MKDASRVFTRISIPRVLGIYSILFFYRTPLIFPIKILVNIGYLSLCKLKFFLVFLRNVHGKVKNSEKLKIVQPEIEKKIKFTIQPKLCTCWNHRKLQSIAP